MGFVGSRQWARWSCPFTDNGHVLLDRPQAIRAESCRASGSIAFRECEERVAAHRHSVAIVADIWQCRPGIYYGSGWSVAVEAVVALASLEYICAELFASTLSTHRGQGDDRRVAMCL